MIAGLLGGLWAKLLAGGAILLGLLTIVWRVLANAKNAGRTERRLEDANAGLAGRLEAKERVQDARTEIDLLGDADDRLARLREHERRARGG